MSTFEKVSNVNRIVGIPVMVGCAIGSTVVGDFLLNQYLPFDYRYPFIILGSLACTLLLGLFLFRYRTWLFVSRDKVLLFLLVASAPLAYLRIGSVDTAEVAMLISFPAWLVIVFVERRGMRIWPPLILLSLCLAMAVLASAINGGFGVVIGARSAVAKIVLMLMLVSLITDKDRLRWVLRLAVIMTLVNTSVAVTQEVRFLADTKQGMREIVATGDARSIDNIKMTSLGPMLRPEGFLKILVPAAIPLLVLTPFSKKILGLAWLLLPAGLLLSVSFGAYVSGGLVALLSIYFRRPSRTIQYSCAIALVVGILYVSGAADWAYGEVGQQSAEDRVELFWMGLDAIARYPLLGIGFQNIGRISIAPEGWSVHNAFFQMAAETGLFGGLSFLAFILMLLVQIGIAAAGASDETLRSAARGLLLVLVALICDFMVEPDDFTIVAWMYLGIIAAAINLYRMGGTDTVLDRGNDPGFITAKADSCYGRKYFFS